MSAGKPRVVVTGYAGWFGQERGIVSLNPGLSLRWPSEEPEAPDLVALVGGMASSRIGRYDPDRIGVCFSSSKGRLGKWTPEAEPWSCTADAAGAEIARSFKMGGPFLSPNAACASGTHAIALGAQLIQDGRADLVLVGAEEPPAPEPVIAGYRRIGALSKAGKMRPFDRRRDGFVPNAGAGVLILERDSGQANHGAVTGWSLMADATHMTAMTPSGSTVAAAIRDALRRAGSAGVDYVNAHATATLLNDAMETQALLMTLPEVPVSGTKGWTGHLLGAAGAIEALICLMAMEEQYLPGTVNLEELAGDCALPGLVREGREAVVRSCLTLNYGFGGHIGALILEK